MRLRNWLLTGTSLAALAMLPGTAFAQQAEYQAFLDAQASGDAAAIANAQQALTEACIVAGYGSVDECIAALTGGGQPAAADPQPDADAEAAARAEAEAAAQAEADAKAQAEAEAAAAAAQAEADAQAQAEAEAAAAAAQAEADAKAQAEAEAAAAAAQAEADAKAQAEAEAAAAAAQAEADAKAQAEAEAAAAAAQAEADAKAQAEAEAAAAAAAAQAQEPAPAEQPAPAAEQPAPAAEPAPAEQPAGPSAEEQQAQFVADLQAALDDYQAALNQAAAGDYAGALPAAQAAEARILELCTANGYPDIASCIGQPLPPLPEAPADQPAAEQPAQEPAAEQPAAEQPADQAPATEQPTEPQGEAGPTDQPADAGVTDPVAAAQDQLGTAVELYNVGVGQLQAGDAAGQSTIDAANRQFADICAALGSADVAACLQQYGITLPPVPELAAPAEPAPPPIADLPGSNLEVTPEAVEVLPEASAPETAAPVLDSAKDVSTDLAAGAPAQVSAPEEPAAPPPTDDRAAQADIAPVEVRSLKDETGEQIAFDALPQMEVPQNVTIINNVTNITNTTNTTVNTTTNNTTINNGGQPGGNRPGDGRPGDGRPGDGRPGDGRPGGGGNNYTNSGFIFQIGVNLVISNPAQDFDRIREDDDDVYYERLPGGRVKETIERPNGVEIVTIRDRWGNVLKRSRIMPDGREYVLAYYDEDDYEDEDYFNNWRDPGDDLPPLRLTIPIRDYIIDADYADEDQVEEFFREPPVEQVRKIYTVEDVKRSARLRDSVRRIEVGSLTFDSGAATISRTQVGALSKVANAMLSLLEDNPGEVFLIEGHTDAVGGDQANLILSDARAATVARILTDFYDVPPENLVTQGYGERYLKVKTDGNEPLNRRVAVKRITPLITVAGRE